MNGTFSTFLVLLNTAWILTSCGNVALSLFQPKTSAFVEDPNSPLADMVTRCGGTATDFSDPDFVILAQNFKSLPILTEGTKDGITYKVQTQASATVIAKSGSNQVTTNVAIVSLEGKDATGTILTGGSLDKVVKPEAEASIKANTGVVTYSGAAGSLILRLSRQEGQFKNVLCAVSFTMSFKDALSDSTGEVRFDQPTPLSLNPKASVSTYNSEIGEGRIFQSNAIVVTPKSEWGQVAGSTPIQVTWKKVSPDINQSSQVTDQQVPAIKADIAYEVVVTSTAIQPYQLGLARRRVYYVDTTAHSFAAIVNDSGKSQTGTTTVLPPTVFIPQ